MFTKYRNGVTFEVEVVGRVAAQRPGPMAPSLTMGVAQGVGTGLPLALGQPVTADADRAGRRQARNDS